MPTTLSSGFAAALSQSVALGLAVRIVRSDGTVCAFNDQTLDVTLPEFTVGSVTVPETRYLANQVRFPAQIQRNLDLQQSNSWELVCLLGGAVTAADVLAGRFLGAKYHFLMYNRNDTTQQAALMRGKVGEVTVAGGEAKFSMRGLADALQQQVLDVTRATSRATWGDPELAFFDLTGNTHDGHAARVTSTIDSVDSDYPRRRLTVSDLAGFPAERFTNGTVQFTDGGNDGFTAGIQIYDHSTGALTLDRDTPVAMTAGDGVLCQIGAPTTIEAWRAYFGSGFGFPGFPGIPTVDQVNAVQ